MSGANYVNYDDSNWNKVQLPHTAREEALVTGAEGESSRQWQGICWYRKSFEISENLDEKVVFLKFDGAMGIAEVWLNEKLLTRSEGGFLPIVLDVTEHLNANHPNVLAVRLDNHDNGVTGPKPLSHLDYNFYGGIYRDVHIIIKNRLHITESNLSDSDGNGGVYFYVPKATTSHATVVAKTHVANSSIKDRNFSVRTLLLDSAGNSVVEHKSQNIDLEFGEKTSFEQELSVPSPKLWSPSNPYLYQLVVEIFSEGVVVDSNRTKVGIRRILINKEGLFVNGDKTFLRGTNRHQEHPYIGYALSNNAQYRDAYRIKNAGFDYVRLSHYPQSSTFLDACDELGLFVTNCISGWQYFSDTNAFKEYQYKQCRELIRRDRNHPCVLLWEVSLNESPMTEAFVHQMNRIARQELEGDQCFTCGWKGDYDVVLEARQHGGCKDIFERPCVVSEYGDWEYYANNAGLKQHEWSNLSKEDRNSRQDFVDGEKGLLQQAINFQEAHNDNLKTKAFADGLWIMFDYNRGYSNDLETSGCMDIFRRPKPSYYFFQSQRSNDTSRLDRFALPIVHIANQWQENSPLNVKVFSNCEEVALHMNGKLIERKSPDDDRLSTHLKHPPFTFSIAKYESGEILAIGYLNGKVVAQHEVCTPGIPYKIDAYADTANKLLEAGVNDHTFLHARISDANSNTVSNEVKKVYFDIEGPGELIGANPCETRGGVASILLRAGNIAGEIRVTASSEGLVRGYTQISTSSSRESSYSIGEALSDDSIVK